MAAILLLTEARVRASMSIPDGLGGASDTILSAISAAQHYVQAMYDTVLSARTTLCLFFVDKEAFSGLVPDGFHRLMLSNAFVQTNPAPVLMFGTTRATCTQVIPSSDYLIDTARGIIKLESKYGDNYVQFTGATGFAGPEDGVPTWLQEVVLAYVPKAMEWARKSDADSPVRATHVSSDHGAIVLAPWVRNIGLCHKPIHSA